MNEQSSGENEATESTESLMGSGCRSYELLARDESALLVVDVQEKLLDAIPDSKNIVWNVSRLIRGAELMNVGVSISEQYPEKLGATEATLVVEPNSATSKRMFSCRECESYVKQWQADRVRQIVVCGIETHVCVLQSVLDYISEGFSVFVVADATSSRNDLDRDVAFRRLELSGATITTTESVLFEWCETSLDPQFKKISALITE